MSGDRQLPFYCPYCGEEDLVPASATPGAWRCRSCARGFELHDAGITPTRQEAPS